MDESYSLQNSNLFVNWLVCQQDARDKQLEQHAKEINLIANESLINDS